MAFAPSKGKKHRRKENEGLSLNSMMDMMTIILLFLLKTMGSSGALLRPSPYVQLPTAAREAQPQKTIAILVTPQGVFEDMEKNPRTLTPPEELGDPNTIMLSGLETFLTEQKQFTEKLGKPFKGEITVQCDKEVTYDWLLKVINTCGQAEYGIINFVVMQAKSS